MATVKPDPSNGSIRLGEVARGSCGSSAGYVTGTVLECAGGSNLTAAAPPAHSALLREQGFSDIAEGTVYALLIRIEQRGLVDVEKVHSGKGPPRKVYSLNAQGQAYLEEFWRTWSFLAERLEQLHKENGSNSSTKEASNHVR